MKKKRNWIVLGICLVLIVGLVLPIYQVLTLYDVKRQQVVASISVHEGDEMVLSFVHSVNKRWVYEYIRIEKNELVVVKTVYDSFGAGMPEGTVANMQPHFNQDGMLEINSMSYRLPEINLFVGTVANHTLTISNRPYVLADFVEPGKPMQIKATQVSLLQLWRGRCL